MVPLDPLVYNHFPNFPSFSSTMTRDKRYTYTIDHHGQTLAGCQTRPRPSLWCFRRGEVSQNPQQAANYSCEVSGGRNNWVARCDVASGIQWKGLRPSNPIVYSALRCCFEIHRAGFALGSSQTAPKLEQLHPMTHQSHFDIF